MARYLTRRLIMMIPTLLLISGTVFLLIRITPGDPAMVVAGADATPAEVERIRREMGLDQPLLLQFLAWLKQVFFFGDFGTSLANSQSVGEMIRQRAQPTLLLALMGGVLSIFIGVLFGVIAGIKHNKLIDRVLMFTSIVGLSVPNFWLGLLLVLALSIHWPILPPAGFESLQEGGVASLRYLILPSIAVASSNAAFLARMVRSSILDVMEQEYIRTARAKGLKERVVIYRHALRNALIPPLTVIGLLIANLASGAVIIEVVFNLPGIGRLLINSVARRDYPTLQAIILITAVLYIVVNMIVDVLYGVLDPRISDG